MEQPDGFVLQGNEHKVCRLVKSLYGLKQAPKQWHESLIKSLFLMDLDTTMRTSAYTLRLVVTMSYLCVYM